VSLWFFSPCLRRIEMNRFDRVTAALRGEEVDRLPYSFWYHFGLQHAPGERHAEAEIEFYKAYKPDFLKVMNDYSFPAPEGLLMIEEVDDWRRLKPLKGDEEGFGEQLKALRIIAKALKDEAYFVETIFSPWTVARRLSDTQTLLSLKRSHPELLLEVMEKISISLAAYARRAVEAGAAGIFLSLSAATSELLTYEEYEKFCRPFDLMILDAVKADTTFNILHIHGQKIFFEELLDYPVQAINWSHLYTLPTLMEGRKIYKGCLLGGIDETRFSHNTVESIERQVRQTVELVGDRNLMITPGCSVQTDSAPKLLSAVGRAVDSLK
jgi:uroporphyrinogen decarboxylase